MDFERAKPADFRLGDIVRPVDASGLYLTFTVKAVNDHYVTLIRPYIHCNDHAWGHTFMPNSRWEEKGKAVATWLGTEELTLQRNDNREYYIERHYKVIDYA